MFRSSTSTASLIASSSDINQSALSPNLSLDELTIFLGTSESVTGYDTTTKRLYHLGASFDLDAGGDVSIRMNAALNANRSSPDAVVLIPDAAFAGADAARSSPSTRSSPAPNGGFEEWAVRDVPFTPPPPPRPPPPAAGTLAGLVFVDQNRNGIFDEGESGLAGVTITLQRLDYLGNAVSLEVQTSEDGAFLFNEVFAGTYTLAEQPLFGYASDSSTAGSEGGDTAPGEVSNITFEDGDIASGYLFGDVYGESRVLFPLLTSISSRRAQLPTTDPESNRVALFFDFFLTQECICRIARGNFQMHLSRQKNDWMRRGGCRREIRLKSTRRCRPRLLRDELRFTMSNRPVLHDGIHMTRRVFDSATRRF